MFNLVYHIIIVGMAVCRVSAIDHLEMMSKEIFHRDGIENTGKKSIGTFGGRESKILGASAPFPLYLPCNLDLGPASVR